MSNPKISQDGTHVNGSASPPDFERFVTDDHPSPSYAGKQSAASTSAAGQQQQQQQSGGLITVQPLAKASLQPSYAQDLGTGSVQHGVYGSFISGLGSCIGTFGAIPCCPLPNPFKEVNQGSVGLVSRFGQFYKAVDPGLVNVNVCSESIRTVDVRIMQDSIPKQTVMTKDNVTVTIDSVLCWHVSDPYKATFGIGDVRGTLVERAQTTLRNVVGSRSLQSVVTERELVAAEIQEIISAPAEKFGAVVESVLIRDIIFSQSLQESLSSAAQAKRIGESKIIAARAEVDAARLMREAADILASPAAMSIRTLDALQAMAKTANSKVIFVPMNVSNMGTHNPGQSAPAFDMSDPGKNIKQIAEHAGEGADFGGLQDSSPVGQAARYNAVDTI